jgi:glycerol-1-phosphate dehydrogenase [NAD(P)+]
MAAAPPRMIRSGLGDSLCRPTAQTDWLLAHHLLGQSYRLAPFTLLAADEPELFENSGALLRGDLAAMERLVRTLVLSGFGTAICGNSRPASQGEPLISHFVDMFGDPSWPPAGHGEQIAVTTLTMARLQERLLEGEAPRVHIDATDEATLVSAFGADLGRSCWADFSQKKLTRKRTDDINAILARDWSRIRTAIGQVVLRSSYLEKVLQRAGAPTTPEALGWPAEFYARATRQARFIRDRYTFLDLAADSGAAIAA